MYLPAMPKAQEVRMDDLAPRRASERAGALPHHRAGEKRMPLSEAIARFVRPGDSVAMGTCLEQMIPFAATREIIRQGIGELTLIGPVSDICFDQIIGAGLARRVMAAWVGNVMMGSAYSFRRAVERAEPRELEVVEFSNFTLALALHATAIGSPWIATRSALGSDLVARNPYLAETRDADGAPALAVKPLVPDVTIVHVQRADPNGNSILWGSLGITSDAARAARAVIVTAEEVVSPEQIRRDPNRVVVPGLVVAAVCEARWGAHPSPVQGYYRRDHETYAEYHGMTKTREGYERWRREWVEETPDLEAYVRRLGNERVAALIPLEHALPEPVDYGY
jgi:glutaconate CoA-transferase subunit A